MKKQTSEDRALIAEFLNFIEKDNLAEIQAMKNSGFDIQVFGDKTLLYACQYQSLKVAQWFIQEKLFKINTINEDVKYLYTYVEENAVYLAGQLGIGTAASLLLKSSNYNKKSIEDKKKLFDFYEKSLLKNGYEVKTNDYCVFIELVRCAEIERLKNLITSNYLDFYGKTINTKLLGEAIDKNHTEFALWLMSHDIDINGYNSNALRQACINQNFPMVKSLIDHGALINTIDESECGFSPTHSQSPLCFACDREAADIDIIRYLVSNGANVSNKNYEIFSSVVDMPLHVWECFIFEHQLPMNKTIKNHLKEKKLSRPDEFSQIKEMLGMRKEKKMLMKKISMTDNASKKLKYKI